MNTFVDTSAFIALLVAEDRNHGLAGKTWRSLLAKGEPVVTSNYIVIETCALLQHRMGMTALKEFLQDVLPAVDIEWVDAPLHRAACSAVMMSSKSGPNIVDCASFAVMRKLHIRDVFTFDGHFADQGFVLRA